MAVDERTRTAWHEAGHALVCAVEFGNVAHVTIKADAATLGHQRAERFAHNAPEALASLLARTTDAAMRELCHRRACAGVRWSLAGAAAEGVLLRRRVPVSGGDALEALAYAAVVAGDDNLVADLVITEEHRRVRRWLGRHRPHLEAIAGQLLARETVDGAGLWATIEGLPAPSFLRG